MVGCRMSKDIKYVAQSKQDFLSQHKDTRVTFDSYYKYKFYFKSTLGLLTMGYGGDSSDIYRFEVSNNDTYLVGDMDWDSGRYMDYTTNTEYSFCD